MAKSSIAASVVKQAGVATNGHVAGHRLPTVSARPDAPDDGRYVTKEEYWANYYTHEDASYEWNNGYLEAKPLSTPVQYRLFLWFLRLLCSSRLSRRFSTRRRGTPTRRRGTPTRQPVCYTLA